MKNIIKFILVLFAGGTYAQTVVPTGNANQVTDFKGGVKVTKALSLPKGDHTDIYPAIDTLARLQVNSADSTLEYHNGQEWKRVAVATESVPYSGAFKNVNLGPFTLYAGALAAGYGTSGITSSPAWLAVRNPTIPQAGQTQTVFGVYNSAGVRGLYSYADETDTQYVNNRGGGNVSSNSAFGNYALSKNTTGTSNVAYGFGALQENTTGVVNAAFGSYALWKNTTGTRNLAVGSQALYNLTTGSLNTAVASQSGISMTTGARNTLIGQSSGRDLTTGNKNTLIGRGAGANVDDATNPATKGLTTGSGNIMITPGLDQGISELSGVQTGNYNTLLGLVTGLNSADSNNVVLADGQGNKAFHKNSTGAVNIAGSSLAFNGNSVPVSVSVNGSTPVIPNSSTGNIDLTLAAGVPYTGATNNLNLGSYGINAANATLSAVPTVNNGQPTTWLTRNQGTGAIETSNPINAYCAGLTLTAIATQPSSSNTIISNLGIIYGNIVALRNYVAKTASYSLVSSDTFVNFTGTTTGTATLPTTTAGKIYYIYNSGTGVITMAGTPNIDGLAASAYKLGANQILIVACDGINYKKIYYSQQANKSGSKSIMTNYMIIISDFGPNGSLDIYVNATTAPVVITLPAVAVMAGYEVNVIKTDNSANAVTIQGAGSVNINQANTYALPSQNSNVRIKSDATQYWVF